MKKNKEKRGRTIIVLDGNVLKAIKKFKRLLTENNVMQDYYKHRFFVKKSDLKKRKKSIGKFKAKCLRLKLNEALNSSY